jgi:hypothetical protein
MLKAANNQRIRCWGTSSSAVEIGGNSYTWTFIRADVKFPILGVDFLRKFNLAVDVAAEQLLPGASEMAARPGCRSHGGMVAAASAELEDWKAV